VKNIKRIATLGLASIAFVGASVAAASPASANGTSAISGATVFSDSTVTAGGGTWCWNGTLFNHCRKITRK
jgi:hypothetical protein